jgi:hypothetical protein
LKADDSNGRAWPKALWIIFKKGLQASNSGWSELRKSGMDIKRIESVHKRISGGRQGSEAWDWNELKIRFG